MTIRELSVELGVSAVYMEDEVALLEEYKLLTALPGGRYQTNLVIFTNDYTQDFYLKAKTLCINKIKEILGDVKSLISDIRKIGFRGCGLGDDRLMWPLLWLIMCRGENEFQNSLPDNGSEEIYSGAAGINYGTDYDETGFDTEKEKLTIKEYDCFGFAGYAVIDEKYAVSYADFGVLPKSCHYGYNNSPVKDSLRFEYNDYPVFKDGELTQVTSILSDPISRTAGLYNDLKELAVTLMKQHAPKSVEPIIEKIVGMTLFFRTVGFIGKCAVDSGALTVPDDGKPIAVYVYEIDDGDHNKSLQDVQS